MTKPGLSAEFQPGLGVLRQAPLSPAALKSLEDIRVRKNAGAAAAGTPAAKAPIADFNKMPFGLGQDPEKAAQLMQLLLKPKSNPFDY